MPRRTTGVNNGRLDRDKSRLEVDCQIKRGGVTYCREESLESDATRLSLPAAVLIMSWSSYRA